MIALNNIHSSIEQFELLLPGVFFSQSVIGEIAFNPNQFIRTFESNL